MDPRRIPKNLVALIKIFNNMPELFAKKLLEHEVFKNDFLINLDQNNVLADLVNNPLKYQQNKKSFKTIDDIDKFYNQFFKILNFEKNDNISNNVFAAKDEVDVLIIQLENALSEENYILASKISQYMKLLNISYTPKF